MSYMGSKAGAGVYQAIIALMPPHDTYVELFAGSGAILQRKPPAALSYAVDLDRKALALIPGSIDAVRCKEDARSYLDNFDYEIGLIPYPSPLPDSGATKPGPGEAGTFAEAHPQC